MANVQTVPAPTAKEEQQASIPNVWKIKDHHVIESMKDEDGKTWIKIEWSELLHLFFDLSVYPAGTKAATVIAAMKKRGVINPDKKGWHKMWPEQEQYLF